MPLKIKQYLILTQKMLIPAFFGQSGTAALSKKAGLIHSLKIALVFIHSFLNKFYLYPTTHQLSLPILQ